MNSFFNLYHLKFFCDAITYGSINEAAKKNFVTQSAVSQAISKLEKHFGVKLITYNRQKLHITAEGKIVYQQAKEIFKSVQETVNKVDETKDHISGIVRFVTTKSLGMSFLAPTYKRVQEELPKVKLMFKMGGLNLIRTRLKREEVEFAIVVYDHNFSQFEKIPIAKGLLNLYQTKGSPPDLIKKGIYVDEFKGTFVQDLQLYFDTLKDESLKVKHQISGWDSVARFTSFGIGVGFFPDYLQNSRYPNIEIHPLVIPNFEYEICAIHNKGMKLSRAARAFIDKFTLE